MIESSIGSGLDISDQDYVNAGATIINAENAWKSADLIVKLKCPSISELQISRDGLSVAALFHAENSPEVVDILKLKRINAYSFEYFTDKDGGFPLMAATGELSGQQAVIYAAYHLQSHLGGSGRHLAACATMKGAKVAILGFGNVGRAAARLALSLGAQVIAFRWGNDELPPEFLCQGMECFSWNIESARAVIPSCDVVIGAIRISTFDTPIFVEETTVKMMRPGSVIIDVTAGFGSGYIETSRQLTRLDHPFTIIHGVKHIKIRELPLGVHITSAHQISSTYGPYVKELILAMKNDDHALLMRCGPIVKDGIVCNSQVARHYKQRFHE